MRRAVIGIAALGALGVAASALAQDRGGPDGPFRDGRGGRERRPMMSEQDRGAFVDARLAALHAGLRLSPDQEKLWPPVEEALRNLVRQRQEARSARRERFMSLREGEPRNIPDQLRFMADRQAASADALRKLADASGPLYGALDEGQKRRLEVLGRFMGQGGGRGWERHGRDRMRHGEMERGERFARSWAERSSPGEPEDD